MKGISQRDLIQPTQSLLPTSMNASGSLLLNDETSETGGLNTGRKGKGKGKGMEEGFMPPGQLTKGQNSKNPHVLQAQNQALQQSAAQTTQQQTMANQQLTRQLAALKQELGAKDDNLKLASIGLLFSALVQPENKPPATIPVKTANNVPVPTPAGASLSDPSPIIINPANQASGTPGNSLNEPSPITGPLANPVPVTPAAIALNAQLTNINSALGQQLTNRNPSTLANQTQTIDLIS